MISSILILALAGATEPAAPPAPGVPPAVISPETTASRGDAYSHLIKARLAAGRGDGTEVLAEVRAAAALVPGSAALRAEGASLLMALGRGSDAEKLARQAIEIDPGQTGALRVLADLASRRAMSSENDSASRDEALRLFEQLARSPDAEDDIFPVLARLRLMAGNTAGAVEAARTLAARRPGDASAARLLAQYLDQAGKKADAVRSLCAFLSVNTDAEELVSLLGELARESGEWEAVEAACTKMVEASPERPAARALRGEALLRLDRGLLAMADLEKVRTLAPENRLVLFQLATAYGDVGRLNDAAGLLRDLARDLPDQIGVRLFLGEILSRQGDFDGALESFRAGLRAIRSDEPDGAERRDAVRRRIAILYLGDSKVDEASKTLSALEKPDDPPSLEIRARVALAGGRAEDALALCRKLREKGDPGLAAALEGEAWVRLGKLDKGRARFDEAAGILGSGVWGRAAQTLSNASQEEAAEKLLRAWARKEPASAAARFNLGAFLERKKAYEEADAELAEAIRLDPKDAVALNYLGYSLADRGQRLDDALGFVRRALEIDPWNAAYLDSLGWVLFRLGRPAEAREPLERAAAEFPRDATVLEHLGDLYDRIGERARAVTLWRRALDSGSTNVESLNAKIARAEAQPAANSPPSPGENAGRGMPPAALAGPR